MVGEIKEEDWLAHFVKHLGGTECGEAVTIWTSDIGAEINDENQAHELNRDIEIGEMAKVMRGMKNNKAPGEDGIRLEFIRGMHSQGLISWH